ncbi:ACT domain-containing protein [Blautia sp. RD014234]|nr:ACT domain-containing protein [Blautia parvula]
MTVKQISVFVENKPGMLAELANALNENKIDMRALSLAETKDFGIIRLILDDPFNAVRVLKDCGYVCSITKVLAIAISNQPGSLGKVMQIAGRQPDQCGIHLCLHRRRERQGMHDLKGRGQ